MTVGNKLLGIGAIAAGLTLGIGPAQAVLIDFADLANTVGEGSIEASGTPGAVHESPLNFGTLFVNVTSPTGEVPYLDGMFSGRDAGLGACTTTNASFQCVPSSDDNVTIDEAVTLEFYLDADLTIPVEVTLSGFEFRDELHFEITDATDTFLLDVDGTMTEETFVGLGPITGQSFTFGYGGSDANQFYLTSMEAVVPERSPAVPEPASLGLFFIGLTFIGFFNWSRRRLSAKPWKSGLDLSGTSLSW